ncbi:MAG: AMP-binding protein [Hyphomicrobiales bacterium]|nr:AMP-binding protein [Hyphomicrobiales bacterium]
MAIFQAGSITYEVLNTAANRLAHRLLDLGEKGDRVALLLPYDPSSMVALLAALKAGRESGSWMSVTACRNSRMFQQKLAAAV